MYKWKRFVQGAGLHDELGLHSSEIKGSSSSECLSGESAKIIYEEIVNEPSEIKSGVHGEPVQHNVETLDPTPKPKKLSLTQLMRLCESNENEELSEYIEFYHDELDINTKDQFGWTLLMSAACSGSLDCVELLLRAGSNWTLLDKSGFTAFQLAQKKRKQDVCLLIEDWARVQRTAVEEGEESSDNSGHESGTRFCEPCNINYTNETKHFKSIAHLVCIAAGSSNDKVHYGIPESNKGFQLMLKTGWDRRGLGSSGHGQKFPVKTVLKRDRRGFGQGDKEKVAKITHFGPFETAAVESGKPEDRLERVGTAKKKEEERQRGKQKRKEIEYRRELGSI